MLEDEGALFSGDGGRKAENARLSGVFGRGNAEDPEVARLPPAREFVGGMSEVGESRYEGVVDVAERWRDMADGCVIVGDTLDKEEDDVEATGLEGDTRDEDKELDGRLDEGAVKGDSLELVSVLLRERVAGGGAG